MLHCPIPLTVVNTVCEGLLVLVIDQSEEYLTLPLAVLPKVAS